MIRSYYFQQQLADVIKEQLKHNFCKVRVACDFSLIYAGKGKGKGKDKGEPSNASAEVKNVEIVVVCRNSRDVLGEKGARLRLLHHKINGAFGFHEDFLRLFVERQCRDDDSDSDEGPSVMKGKGKGKKGYFFDEMEVQEPKKPDKVKVPKPKPKPERRREIPENFGPEQWKDCALRCARLDLIFRRNEEVFAPVQMLLQDPLRYGVRLWREYNLRAKPKQRSAEPGDAQPSWDSPVVGDWGVADDWGAPVDVGGWDAPVDDGWGAHDDKDPGSASASLTEEEKMAARAKRFATPSTVKATTSCSSLIVKDFGSDEDVQLDNLDLSQALCADVIERLKEIRCFPKNVEPTLVLMPSGEELPHHMQISKIPAGETLKFMSLARSSR